MLRKSVLLCAVLSGASLIAADKKEETATVHGVKAPVYSSMPHKLTIALFRTSSKEYADYLNSIAGQDSDTINQKIKEFAEVGEPAAVCTIQNMSKDKVEKESTLRTLAENNANIAAQAYFAEYLLADANAECLTWFERACQNELASKSLEAMHVYYASALLFHTRKDKPALDKAWEQLKFWVEHFNVHLDWAKQWNGVAPVFLATLEEAKKMKYMEMPSDILTFAAELIQKDPVKGSLAYNNARTLIDIVDKVFPHTQYPALIFVQKKS